MEDKMMTHNSDFIHPHSHYYGELTPENVQFHNQMEDFVQESTMISNLAGNGKMSLDDAFGEIEKLWQQLIQSKQELRIGKSLQAVK
jgi:hypothetical protein